VGSQPRVLVIDDGELARIRGFLADFGIEAQHLRGEVFREDLEGPFDLVIASVKRTLAFEDSVELSSLPGKPVWIAVHAQDFLPLRVRLQRMGVQYLVQSSVGSEALRLLLLHSLYRGPERRAGVRLPVGMPVAGLSEAGEGFRAELLDLTRGGCRLLVDREFDAGIRVDIEVPSKLAGGESLVLPGVVVRTEPHPGRERNRLAIEFRDLEPESVALIEAILEGKIIGTVVTRLAEPLARDAAAPPASRGSEESCDPETTPGTEGEPEYPHTRHGRRRVYERNVTALLSDGPQVILGRDLSIGGMRSEPLPDLPVGTELELAIYGSSGAEPVLVKAVVARDDGELGTVFHFTETQDWERPRLEAIVNAGAEIRSLSEPDDGDRVVVARAAEDVTRPRRRR